MPLPEIMKNFLLVEEILTLCQMKICLKLKKILLKASRKFKWTYLIYDNYQNNKYSNVNNIEAFNFFLKKKNYSICLRIDF